ncbi:GNAT family N-acetyltransferase [Peribacillus huizhouensis]
MIHKKDQFIIGDMGFKGGPNAEGMIDIGYSVVQNYQGYGYAIEKGKALVKWGLYQRKVKEVVATCNPDNILLYVY